MLTKVNFPPEIEKVLRCRYYNNHHFLSAFRKARYPAETLQHLFSPLSLLFSYFFLFFIVSHISSPTNPLSGSSPGESLAWFPLQANTQLAFIHYLCLSVFSLNKRLFCVPLPVEMICLSACSFKLSKL